MGFNVKVYGSSFNVVSDIKKYQFVESLIRVGVSMICKGYAEANIKFMKSYDSNKPTSYIVYLDANNLYGHSMMKLLSTEILDWVIQEILI